MANTAVTWSDLASAPSLAAMAVNDTKDISGVHSSVSRVRALCNSIGGIGAGGFTTAKKFTVAQNGYNTVRVTRTA